MHLQPPYMVLRRRLELSLSPPRKERLDVRTWATMVRWASPHRLHAMHHWWTLVKSWLTSRAFGTSSRQRVTLTALIILSLVLSDRYVRATVALLVGPSNNRMTISTSWAAQLPTGSRHCSVTVFPLPTTFPCRAVQTRTHSMFQLAWTRTMVLWSAPTPTVITSRPRWTARR